MMGVIIYLVVMAAIYIYMRCRSSSGYFWLCLYVLILWPLEAYFSAGFIYAIFAVGFGLIAVFESLHYFGKDPFSTLRLDAVLHRAVNVVGNVLKSLGFRPQTRLLNLRRGKVARRTIRYWQAQRWRKLEQFLKRLPSDERYSAIDALVDQPGRPELFDQWLAERPKSAMAYIVSGHQLIHWAWEARGSGLANTVNDQKAELFFMRLLAAKASLENAIGLDNSYADPYVGLITISMGTAYEQEKLWHYFAKALVYCPNHYKAHSAMVNALAQKWGGKAGEMFIVAYQAAKRMQTKHCLAGVVAEAHLEQWLYLLLCDQDEEAQLYFRQTDVRHDLRRAYEQINTMPAKTTTQIEVWNLFACCFYLSGLNCLAKTVLRKLNGQFTEHPWAYLHESRLAFFDTAYNLDVVLQKLNRSNSDLPDAPV